MAVKCRQQRRRQRRWQLGCARVRAAAWLASVARLECSGGRGWSCKPPNARDCLRACRYAALAAARLCQRGQRTCQSAFELPSRALARLKGPCCGPARHAGAGFPAHLRHRAWFSPAHCLISQGRPQSPPVKPLSSSACNKNAAAGAEDGLKGGQPGGPRVCDPGRGAGQGRGECQNPSCVQRPRLVPRLCGAWGSAPA